MPSTGFVTIDCFPSSLPRYGEGWAVVAVDVIRATTTAVTAVATGRRCYPVATLEQAHARAATLHFPLLAGELDGVQPRGFEEHNSPAAFVARSDVHRPLVLLSTSGTQLLQDIPRGHARYAACLRNTTATITHLAATHDKVAVIGAGTHGEFREEDVLGCARIAGGLLDSGFDTDDDTRELVGHWRGQPLDVITRSRSVDYLRRTDQLADLHFVLTHVDDLDATFTIRDQELVGVAALRTALPQGAA